MKKIQYENETLQKIFIFSHIGKKPKQTKAKKTTTKKTIKKNHARHFLYHRLPDALILVPASLDIGK